MTRMSLFPRWLYSWRHIGSARTENWPVIPVAELAVSILRKNKTESQKFEFELLVLFICNSDIVESERQVYVKKWAVQSLEDPTRKGLVPIVVLQAQEEETLEQQDIIFPVISELLETEEEFCRDLKDVVERYIRPLDGPKVPRWVSDKKDSLFGNFREISIFHNTVLLEGIKYYAKEQSGLGRAFLRM
ncbi:unnamed protein product, partial [Nesidiocoris tenuis]